MNIAADELPHAHGRPPLCGRIRCAPEDFIVIEELGWQPDGSGEHVFLYVRKSGQNTDWVARRLAEVCEVRADAVSYAGLKDRHAVTEQWFSVQMPGREAPMPCGFTGSRGIDGVEVLAVTRNSRKLRRGALAGNRFRIVVRELDGPPAAVLDRLPAIAARGVPNWFGEQRFGRDGGNLERARRLLAGTLRERDRHKRGLYLSAARSHLFNRYLAARIIDGSWDQALPGEVLMLDGSHSVFACPQPDATILERLARHDLHPSGPLWGAGESLATAAALAGETALAAAEAQLCAGLAAEGLKQERRALRLVPAQLHGEAIGEAAVQFEFTLPAGAYATTVLHELVGNPEAQDDML
ncbi:tRNA pseudouridine(13) synthase TruD [Plasticicumulans sp.]|uniref:tRNA pseudouridine(13) synthase TruD n=1 Tax=Plasticicumulans sp. TaxID=2307179 RepID=UPI002D1FB758|nr:tRNA pseudouridine(13) synthase TruD [Plasticicumulans sp.]